MDARRDDTSWLERVSEQHGPWDGPGWSCCGDPACPFVEKCRDVERLDAAYLAGRAEH